MLHAQKFQTFNIELFLFFYFFAKHTKTAEKVIYQKKNKGHQTSKMHLHKQLA